MAKRKAEKAVEKRANSSTEVLALALPASAISEKLFEIDLSSENPLITCVTHHYYITPVEPDEIQR